MGSRDDAPGGYDPAALDRWAARARTWADGGTPDDLATHAAPAEATDREVFLYVISGAKHHNPAAAMALIERIA